MSYDYDDDIESPRMPRSRKKPSMRGRSSVNKRSDASRRMSAGGARSSRAFSESAAARVQPVDYRKRRIIIMIIAEIIALLLIVAYAHIIKTYTPAQVVEFRTEVTTNPELTKEDLKKMKGYWMIAVFGVDSRNGNLGKGTNADVNMICCINQDTGEIKLVSVFRDSYLNIDDKGTYNKINQAYANGGPEQAVAALNKNLDLNITDYITFNWKAVAEAINILGGIDVELSKAEFKYINGFITETVNATGIGSHHLKSAGMNHLDGVQAVAYGRLRLMDTDYARTERQRKVIELAFEKAKKAEYSVLNNILVVVLPQVLHSLDFVDLTNMALSINKYSIGETTGFPMARGEANMGKKGSCVVPATLESNVILLHQFLFEDEIYTPTDSVKKISAKIASDTGIYKEGQVIGHVSTEGVLPKETQPKPTVEESAQLTTEEHETTAVDWNSEMPGTSGGSQGASGDLLPTESSSRYPGESSSRHPGIGETDSDGNLVDGPDETESGTGPGYQVTQPTTSQTRPGSTPETTSQVQPGVPETTSGLIPGGPSETTSSASNPTISFPGETVNSGNQGPVDVINSDGPGA